MWANTPPHGGVIVVGVENDGAISGCRHLSPEKKNRLESLSEYCPDARWAHKDVAVKDRKGKDNYIIAIRVKYRDNKLVQVTSGDAFIREGEKKLRLLDETKREVRIAKGEIHYELEPVPLIFPKDFDSNEVRRFCKAFVTNRRYKTPKGVEDILALAKLGKTLGGKFRPNLACSLLFAKDPREVVPGSRIRVIRYEGEYEQFGEHLNAVFSTYINGCIPKMLAEARAVISSQVRTFKRLATDGRFQITPEYPEPAWFEAIVNAVAHRSYNFRTQNIFVKLFDDRFVVESPGGFVPPTTAATVYDAHNPRNPFLMEAMMHLELTFCGFEGTRRMRHEMQIAGLPEPRFQQRRSTPTRYMLPSVTI